MVDTALLLLLSSHIAEVASQLSLACRCTPEDLVFPCTCLTGALSRRFLERVVCGSLQLRGFSKTPPPLKAQGFYQETLEPTSPRACIFLVKKKITLKQDFWSKLARWSLGPGLKGARPVTHRNDPMLSLSVSLPMKWGFAAGSPPIPLWL